VVVDQVEHQVAVHQAEQTEKARQVIRVAKAETLDQTHIQVLAEVAEEPL
jgi:hypothetical protein